MIIQNFLPFAGQHCETTATGSLLLQLGIQLPEPLLFGLGEGLGFIFWNQKQAEFPFIGGRIKPDLLTENLCRNLDLRLEVKETTSTKKAWQQVAEELQQGRAVGLKLDSYHLEYFHNKIHFAGHYVAMYGYDDRHAYLVDTQQQGGAVKTTLESLAAARSEKGPMASKNLSYQIFQPQPLPDLGKIIPLAIHRNATEYLNPPITNIGYKGILKFAEELKPWFLRSQDKAREFQTTAMLMERAGTGGALFRNLYRDFLAESHHYTPSEIIKAGHMAFTQIAKGWTEVARLLGQAGASGDDEFIDQATTLLHELSQMEQKAMTSLQELG